MSEVFEYIAQYGFPIVLSVFLVYTFVKNHFEVTKKFSEQMEILQSQIRDMQNDFNAKMLSLQANIDTTLKMLVELYKNSKEK